MSNTTKFFRRFMTAAGTVLAFLALLASPANASPVFLPFSDGDGVGLAAFVAAQSTTACKTYNKTYTHDKGLKDAVTGEIQWKFHFDITVSGSPGNSICHFAYTPNVYFSNLASGWSYAGTTAVGETTPSDSYTFDILREGEFDYNILPPACEPCYRYAVLAHYPEITWHVSPYTGAAYPTDNDHEGAPGTG